MATEKSGKMAAQVWCRPEASHIVMDCELAEAFANALDEFKATIPSPLTAEQAQEKAEKIVSEWWKREFVSALNPHLELLIDRISELMAVATVPPESFQDRVDPWLMKCVCDNCIRWKAS